MKQAIEETNRRRKIQANYNKKHGLTPKQITKAIRASFGIAETDQPARDESTPSKEYLKEYQQELQFKMDLANRNLQFDEAMRLKQEIDKLLASIRFSQSGKKLDRQK